MQPSDSLQLRGEVRLTLSCADGTTEERFVRNLIVQVGHNFVANAILNSSTSPFTYMAVGSGTNAPAAGDTTLQTEITRIAFSSANITGGNVVNLSTSYTPGVATGTISEAGVFNAATNGTMLARTTFGAITKGAADTLVVNWTITA